MFGWILLIGVHVFGAAYILAGAVAGYYESSQTSRPFRRMTLIDWMPRIFGWYKRKI